MTSGCSSSPARTQRRSRRSLPRRLALLLVLAALGAGAPLRAQETASEFRLIVHPSHSEPSAPRAFLADAFLKKVTRWSGGATIHPVDLRPTAAVRHRFTENVLKRSVGAVRSYWQQRIFSGRDVPPPELDSDEAV